MRTKTKKARRSLKCRTPKQILIYLLLNLSVKTNIFERNYVILYDLIAEKDTAPIDNFAFFEYAMNKKDKPFRCFYVLNKKNKNYDSIKKKYGKYIIGYKKKSFVFILKIVFLNFKTKYILDSYDTVFSIFRNTYRKSKNIDVIFTQHGVTFFKDDFIKETRYGAKNMDKVIVSNDFEYETFKHKGKFEDKNIIKLGLFRWDKIKNKEPENEKYIFIYFTYRHYLKTEKDILNTTYFKNCFSLLNDKKLQDCLSKNNIKIKMAPHHSLLPFLKLNKLNEVEIVCEEDIADVKNKASMLITDYSSMSFDFMIQEKPVIFYRLDEKEFLKSEKDFEFSRNIDSLTPLIFNVYNKEDDVVNKVLHYIKNNFKIDADELRKAKKFFYVKKNIREKFYNYLLSLLKRK